MNNSSSNWLSNVNDWFSDWIEVIRNNVMVSILVFLLFIFGAWGMWSYATTERITTTQYLLKQHARLNDYYASELLLNQRSLDAIDEEVASTKMDMDLLTLVENLPEPIGYYEDDYSDEYSDEDSDEKTDKKMDEQTQSHPVLIIRSIGDSLLTDDKYQQLIDWIEQGGHLITFSKSAVDEDDWQAVQQRLQQITPDEIATDDKLQELLNDINQSTNNSLLNKLNIYPVRSDNDYCDCDDEDSDNNSDSTSEKDSDKSENSASDSKHTKKQAKLKQAYKEFQKTLDSLGLKDTEEEDADKDDKAKRGNNGKDELKEKKQTSDKVKDVDPVNEPVVNLEQVRSHIEDLYKSQSVLMLSVNTGNSDSDSRDNNASDDNVIMIDSGNYRYLDSQLFFATYPQAKMRDDFAPATATQIRNLLKSQFAVLDKMILQGAKIEEKNQKNGDLYFTPTEQKKTIELLLKLSDEQLQTMFGKVSNSLFDSSFGAGRITVLDNRSLWNNPDDMVINDAKQQQDFLDGKDSANIISLFSSFNNSPKIDLFNDTMTSLYSKNNASLLINLTEDSVQTGESIWLFPNVDIDSLPVMLWKKSRLAVLGLGLLTMLWLWSLYNRFGKRQYLDNSQSADIFRYFRQIGRYGWEYDKAKRLSKVTRTQADKMAKKVLALKSNELLNHTHMVKLSQILQALLMERLQESGNDSRKNDELLAMMDANQEKLLTLLTPEQLELSLLPTANDLDNLTAHGFTEYTQTLWLVKWLLG